MALAPALDITISAAFIKCGISSFTYSNCMYPFLFSKVLSKFPFPHIWTILYAFKSTFKDSLTISFINFEPRLPPTIRRIGLSSLKLHILLPIILLPSRISFRIGVPVRIPFLSFILFNDSGKVTHILVHKVQKACLQALE